MKKILLFTSLLFSYAILSQQPQIASDINQGNSGSSLGEFFKFKNKLFFSAEIGVPFTSSAQKKLWVTDGTEAGSMQINNLPDKGYYTTDNHLYYADYNKIYKSDGTEANTVVVAENLIEIDVLATYDNFIYYIADITQNYDNRNMGLYKTDGNTTTLLKTFLGSDELRVDGSPIDIISKFDDTRVIIYLKTKDLGNEPYISDGTETGTYLLKDIVVGNGSSGPTAHINLTNGNIFQFGRELWFTDSTEVGTIKIKDSNVSNLTVLNNKAYFSIAAALWETDGTIAGTKMIFDNKNGNGGIQKIVNRGTDLLLFLERGIHIFDGTSANTIKITTPNITHINGFSASTPTKTYFVANYKDEGNRLWVTNGTDIGTKSITPFWPDGQTPTYTMHTLGESLLFSSGSHLGKYNTGELWVSDGTDEGTKLLKDINKSGNLSSNPKFQTELNGKIYFAADDNIHGRELFVFDGNSTTLVKDIYPGFNSSNPFDFYVLNNKIIFKAFTLDKGLELWITDGTEAGTHLLKDINLTGDGFLNDNRAHVRLKQFKKFNNELYFYADNGVNGMELWKTNGTNAGTFMIKDINSGFSSSYRPALDQRPTFVEHNNELYFYVSNLGSNNNLSSFNVWKTDGTTEGTAIVNFLEEKFTQTGLFFSFNNQFYILGIEDITKDVILYKTDFTTVTKIKDLPKTYNFYPLNDKVYFLNEERASEKGQEFWALDKNDNFAIVADIVDGGQGSSPSDIYKFKDYLYFSIRDINYDLELWRLSDTTAPEKIISKDNINPSSRLIETFDYIPVNNKLIINSKEYNGNTYQQNFKVYVFSNSSETEEFSFEINDKLPYKNFEGDLSVFSAVLNNTFYLSGEIDEKGNELLMVDMSTALNVDEYNNRNIENKLNITIYPNPAENILNIKTNSKIKTGIIYNLLGKKIKVISSNFVDVSKLKPGIYILKIEDESGNISSKKWIKN